MEAIDEDRAPGIARIVGQQTAYGGLLTAVGPQTGQEAGALLTRLFGTETHGNVLLLTDESHVLDDDPPVAVDVARPDGFDASVDGRTVFGRQGVLRQVIPRYAIGTPPRSGTR